jgi:type II restriction enzyme
MRGNELAELVERYKSDRESVYNTWFINGEERLKAFRSIRRGVGDVVESIAAGTFGNDFKGSPLEVVLNAITEQKQVFSGAAHPFYWKPKLRIPDIYESAENQRTFGAFLQACLAATSQEQVLVEMSRLADAGIKGLGPSVANIVYFLHPEWVPPFNTAMVNGFNELFDENAKLGSWAAYRAMREVIVHTNARPEIRGRLSRDLGAFAGLLFEIGSLRLRATDNMEALPQAEKEKAAKTAKRRHIQVQTERKEESEHTHIQYLLIKIGRALNFDVHVARNDRHRSYDGHSFAMETVPKLPVMDWSTEVRNTVELIDVVWLKPGTGAVVSAFEVEKSTSIYSGILRLEDLARSVPQVSCDLYIVAPDNRKKEVMAQFCRPAFSDLSDMSFSYISFGDLCGHCDGLCMFGEDHTALGKISSKSLLA